MGSRLIWIEHLIPNQGVVGSSPIKTTTSKTPIFAFKTPKVEITGSNPVAITIFELRRREIQISYLLSSRLSQLSSYIELVYALIQSTLSVVKPWSTRNPS